MLLLYPICMECNNVVIILFIVKKTEAQRSWDSLSTVCVDIYPYVNWINRLRMETNLKIVLIFLELGKYETFKGSFTFYIIYTWECTMWPWASHLTL